MSSPFLAKFFIIQVLLFQPMNIHGFLYKEMPMDPFFKWGAIFYCINDPTVLVWIFVY